MTWHPIRDGALLAAAVLLSGCGNDVSGPPASASPPPVRPSVEAIRQALLSRIAWVDEPFPAASGPDEGVLQPCSTLYRVDSLSVAYPPAGSPATPALDATWQVTLLALEQQPSTGARQDAISDCFGSVATRPASWAVGQTVTFHAAPTIAYVGPYWLVSDGNAYLPLANGAALAATNAVTAPP